MDHQRRSADDLLRRVAIDYWTARRGTEAGGTDSDPQRIPVNVYETDEDVVIVHVPLRQVSSSQATHQGHSGHHSTRRGLEGDRSSSR